MAFNVSTVTAWIAGLPYTGIKQVLDLDKLPTAVPASACPLLMPDPSGPFITNVSAEWESFGASRSYLLHYTLHYVLFYAPLGQGTVVYQVYPALVDTAMGIAATFLTHTNPTGAESMRLAGDSVPHFEPVLDGGGVGFHGAKFALEFLEIV